MEFTSQGFYLYQEFWQLSAAFISSIYICVIVSSTDYSRADPGVFPRFPESGQITSG